MSGGLPTTSGSARSKHIGARFGMWIVEEVYRLAGKPTYFAKARCDCGTVMTVILGNLVKGDSLSCGCNRHVRRTKHRLLGDPITVKDLAKLAGLHPRYTSWCLGRGGMTPERLLEKHNEPELLRLKLSKTKKRGRPLKTLDGREISHEELLRGLVHNQAVRDAS
jgi:hypothetical protein